jgi:DNA polymerase III epsilon subunit-like protein
MMNYRDYIVYDFETTSANPYTTQPVQIAAVVVHGRKLEIKEGSQFQSLIKPIFDKDKCAKLGIDPLEDGAVAVHGKTEEILQDAPSAESVWKNFIDYVNQFNFKGGNWSAPISVGYNIKGFDSIIVNRLCTSPPYKFGPVDSKRGEQDLFNRIHSIDMLDFMFAMFENNKDVNSLSADNLIRGYMGYSNGKAHDAMDDVIMTAELFCRTMKMLRSTAARKNFKNAFSN